MRTFASLLLLCVLVLGTGCQSDLEPLEATPAIPPSGTVAASPTFAPVSSPQGGVQMTPPAPTPSDPALQGLIEMAKADLAQRLSLPATAINFAEATAVEWSDSSLGCPQPDVAYLQVITPGYRILLEAGGQTYAYHTDRGTRVLYCEEAIPPGLPKP